MGDYGATRVPPWRTTPDAQRTVFLHRLDFLDISHARQLRWFCAQGIVGGGPALDGGSVYCRYSFRPPKVWG
jgi:hypothetical protein